jgi:hypothetical protein
VSLDRKKEESGDMEACCAWDLAVGCTWIRRLKKVPLPFPAFVTLGTGTGCAGTCIVKTRQAAGILYSRPQPAESGPAFDLDVGVTVATLASYYSADDYRYLIRKTIRRQEHVLPEAGW